MSIGNGTVTLPETIDLTTDGCKSAGESMVRPDVTERFLRTYFDYAPDHLWIHLFFVNKKDDGSDEIGVQWYRVSDLRRVSVEIEVHCLKWQNVYFSTGLYPVPPQSGRGTSKHVGGIAGLRVDIDILSPVHSKGNLPPTVDDALKILAAVELRPTWVIFTGHGIQAHWQFKEPWLFAPESEEWGAAAAVNRAWTETLQHHARKLGYDADSTGDLTRVLRLPGGTNRKTDTRLVDVLEFHECFYSPSDFEPHLLAPLITPRTGPIEPKAEGAPAPIEPLLEGCSWLRHCIHDAKTLPEPEWKALADLCVRLEGGNALFHQWSKPHPGYDPQDAEDKFRTAAERSPGPPTCRRIRTGLDGEEHCAGCAQWGDGAVPKIKSPIVLGRGSWKAGVPPRALNASAAQSVPADPRTDADEDDDDTHITQWPSPMNSHAFHGLAGNFVDTVLPHTEADEAALLFDFLATFGNAIGRGAFFEVGAARHTTNLYAAMVGRSSKGRKGTAHQEVERVFRHADPLYVRNRIMSGLSSGEGLIYNVRDQIEKRESIKEKGKHTGKYQTVVVDEGVDDKRLLVIEPEFASVLRVMTRDGNTLSPIVRQAWDSGTLQSMVKNSPLRATNAHISILAHVTKAELLKCLDDVDYSNGFANRILWVAVRRSKLLPDGGCLDWGTLEALGDELGATIKFASDAGQPRRDAEARELWHAVYPQLTAERTGPAGAATSRAEAQVVRLSLIYALLDRSLCIRTQHIESALEAWRYCEDSAIWIFGQGAGNAFADAILDALRAAANGLSRTEIHKHFQGHKSREEIKSLLVYLADQGQARMAKQSTSGRPKETWYAL